MKAFAACGPHTAEGFGAKGVRFYKQDVEDTGLRTSCGSAAPFWGSLLRFGLGFAGSRVEDTGLLGLLFCGFRGGR